MQSVSDFIFYFGIITGFSNWIMNAVYQYWGRRQIQRALECAGKVLYLIKDSANK